MKREEISSGTMDKSKGAIIREGCGYYNEETILKPQLICTWNGSLTLLPLFFEKAAKMKNQEARLLKHCLT